VSAVLAREIEQSEMEWDRQLRDLDNTQRLIASSLIAFGLGFVAIGCVLSSARSPAVSGRAFLDWRSSPARATRSAAGDRSRERSSRGAPSWSGLRTSRL